MIDWAKALCREVDPEIFFPEERGNPEPAKSICRLCTVRTDCLGWAIDHTELGVWGGTTEKERSKLRKRKAAA